MMETIILNVILMVATAVDQKLIHHTVMNVFAITAVQLCLIHNVMERSHGLVMDIAMMKTIILNVVTMEVIAVVQMLIPHNAMNAFVLTAVQ